MATRFTINQQRAVDETGHNILVAASAGSGKTTVLIERLIQKILSGISVENFLIVTFTNAAAKEMRERLEIAIEKRLRNANDGMKRFLQEQLLLLPAANISTIDAYALRLIENYYHVIGLDPQFRLLSDTAERDMMRQDVLDTVFEAFYDETHPQHENFIALVNNFGNPNQDDALRQAVLKLSDFAEARPDGQQWLKELDKNDLATANGLTQSQTYRLTILPMMIARLEQLLEIAQATQTNLSGVPELKKTQQAFDEIIAYLVNVQQALVDDDWDTLRGKLSQLPKVSLETKRSKGIKDEPELLVLLAQATTVKNNILGAKSDLKNVIDTFFKFDQNDWQYVEKQATGLVNTLVTLTQACQSAFTTAKRDAQLVDFPDLGALALEILNDDMTRKTVSGQFQEILVDEYQDINQLQETLLTKVSNGHNMYMVGDVKQSIYGFRQAEPTLFARKYRQFALPDNPDSRIELADNFRSQNNVTRVTNLIFTQLMDEKLGDIAYTGEAKLVPKANYPTDVTPVFNMTIIKQPNVTTSEDEDESQEFEKRQAQYAQLANQILSLRDTTIFDRKAETAGMRPVQYGDIAILTRSKTGYIDLVATLRQAGIPTQVDSVGNYFQTMEVYLMLDVLRVIDNPHQDIPLAAILRSPMFGYSENDLAAVRLADKKHDYWSALTVFAQADQRSQTVIDLIKKWHQLAIQNDLVALIWAIFDDTSWLDYVAGMPGGAQRQANLHALYDYARTYQENTHAGLFRFIRYIEQLQENDGQLGEAPQEANEQAVRIMTIHASKGLEFPIVFLPEFDKSFNTQDLSGKMLIQKNAGIGLEYLQPEALVAMPTLKKLTVQQALKRQSWSEEMRLLYVALTRAEQQIYVVGTVKLDENEENQRLIALWQRAKETSGQFLAEDLRLSAKSYFDWLLISLARTKNDDLESWLGDGHLPHVLGPETTLDSQISVRFINESDVVIPEPQGNETKEITRASTYQAEDFARAKAILDYQYPFQQATRTAAYQSVSEMKRLFEDPDRANLKTLNVLENGQLQPANELVSDKLVLPTFMTDGSQKPSSAAVGTATHLMLQLLDFKQIQTHQSLTALRDDLVTQGRLTAPVAALIDIDQILNFLQTPFAQRLRLHADSLRREATFAMIMPANQIYEHVHDQASVLVHGIIDGYFIDKKTKSITLFDYKTDFVRHGRVEEDISKMMVRYRGQLTLYKQALMQEFPDYTFYEPQLIILNVGRVIPITTK